MGHGTEHEFNKVYAAMQEKLAEKGYKDYFIGTVEAEPSLQDVVDMVKEAGYTKAILQPLMIVAGDHANNDMAGDDEDSWKSSFEAEGYEVECVLHGLGELPAIQQLFAEHAQAAVDSLK
jgi:sirohydrochlorin cobaltochelatase